MEDGRIVRFEVGKAFPADDSVARWVTVCCLAVTDLFGAMHLLMPRLREKGPRREVEAFFLTRVFAERFFEAANFLADSYRDPEVDAFLNGLGDRFVRLRRELADLGEEGSGNLRDRLEHAATDSFDYRGLFAGDGEGGGPLIEALDTIAERERLQEEALGEIRDVRPTLESFLAVFSHDVSREMFLPDTARRSYVTLGKELIQWQITFVRFTRKVLEAYVSRRPAGTWEVDAVENPDFIELLGKLHSFIGEYVDGTITLEERFFALRFDGRLERVENAVGESVVLEFSNGISIDIAPDEQVLEQDGEFSFDIRVPPGADLRLKIEDSEITEDPISEDR